MIGLTLLEFTGTITIAFILQIEDTWVLFLIKIVPIALFLCVFKEFDSLTMKRFVWTAYTVITVLEVISITAWCLFSVNSEQIE